MADRENVSMGSAQSVSEGDTACLLSGSEYNTRQSLVDLLNTCKPGSEVDTATILMRSFLDTAKSDIACLQGNTTENLCEKLRLYLGAAWHTVDYQTEGCDVGSCWIVPSSGPTESSELLSKAAKFKYNGTKEDMFPFDAEMMHAVHVLCPTTPGAKVPNVTVTFNKGVCIRPSHVFWRPKGSQPSATHITVNCRVPSSDGHKRVSSRSDGRVMTDHELLCELCNLLAQFLDGGSTAEETYSHLLDHVVSFTGSQAAYLSSVSFEDEKITQSLRAVNASFPGANDWKGKKAKMFSDTSPLAPYNQAVSTGRPVFFNNPKDRRSGVGRRSCPYDDGGITLDTFCVIPISDTNGVHSCIGLSGATHYSASLVAQWESMMIGVRGVIQSIAQVEKKFTAPAANVTETYEKLQAEMDKLSEDMKVKSHFLAMMSHEIRTPLNGIMGMLEILQSTNLRDEQIDYVQTCVQSADSLLRIVDDVLVLSKCDSGQMKVERTDVEIFSLVQDTLRALSPNVSENIDMVYSIEPDVPEKVVGDATKLKQILVNLLGNAIKFCSEGEIAIEVSRVYSPAEDASNKIALSFEVSDTGIGMSALQIANIFKPFAQADDSITRNYGGTGLGLHISKELVSVLGGHLTCRSQEKRGSTFTFIVPFEELNTALSPPFALKHEFTEEDQRLMASLNILYVGKNPINLSMVKNAIKCGFPLSSPKLTPTNSLASCRDAIQLSFINKNPFNNIVIDAAAGVDPLEILLTVSEMCDDLPPTVVMAHSSTTEIRQFAHVIQNRPIERTKLLHTMLRCARQIVIVDAPQADVGGTSVATPEIGSSGDEGPKRRENEMRLLIAEDNEVNRMAITLLLQSLGHQVFIFENGLLAVNAFCQRPTFYDAILLDLHMPVMDGFAAASAIREWETMHSPKRRMPIIAVTADISHDTSQRCHEVDIDYVLRKPIKTDEIMSKITHLVKANQAAAPLSRRSHSQTEGNKDGDKLKRQHRGKMTMSKRVKSKEVQFSDQVEEEERANKLKEQKKVAEARDETMPQAPAPTGPDNSLFRVLVVDDNNTSRKVMFQLVKRIQGCSCDVANSAQEALKLFKSQKYNLVFTDIHMPLQDGYELAESLRATEKERGSAPITILGLTGDHASEKIYKDRGLSGVLFKPVTGVVVRSAIRDAKAKGGQPVSHL